MGTCGAFHKFQRGTVVVEPKIAEGLLTQEDIDAEAARQIAVQEVTTDRVEELVSTGYVSDREEKPGGGNLWIVSAGMGPQEAEVLEFVPRHLAISLGDTVVWTSVRYHAVVFSRAGRQHTAVLSVRGAGAGSPEHRDQSSGAVAGAAVWTLRTGLRSPAPV